MRPLRTTLSKENLKYIGIPRRFFEVTLKDFNEEQDESLEEVKECISDYIFTIDKHFDEGTGLFLYGSNGVGKTMLASIIAREAYRHRYTARRLTFVSYISLYTATFNARSIDERERCESELHRAKAVDFLVLEEVGKEVDSKIALPILEELLRYREDEMLPTIFCTNLTPKIIGEKYGASVMSLLKGNMFPIKIDAQDKREDLL